MVVGHFRGYSRQPQRESDLTDIDWLAMCNGHLDGVSAFMSKKLKATGNLMLAQQIRTLFLLG